MKPLNPIQIAAIHHGLVLLVARSRARIDQLVASGNGQTEIAEYWRCQLSDAQQTLEIIGIGRH